MFFIYQPVVLQDIGRDCDASQVLDAGSGRKEVAGCLDCGIVFRDTEGGGDVV